jgi:hypothetical protein
MGILNEKYRYLRPSLALLVDPVILAQAWKKADSYIRRYNSYADVLELDCSVVNAESLINSWAGELKEGAYKPNKMKIVPAPKNCAWEFGSSGWNPVKKQDLRPLAHLSIRDQSIALAAMLCLADAVETAQGSTLQPNLTAAQKQGVFSYGNRLHCEWKERSGKPIQAHFGWGNSNTYSKYFQDYQRFLKRPGTACERSASALTTGRALFVLKLDLESFFDRIHRPTLIHRLQKIWGSTQITVGHFSPASAVRVGKPRRSSA